MNNRPSSMAKRASLAALLLLVSAVASVSPAQAADSDLAPLPIELPEPAYSGTRKDIPADTTAEKPTGKPRPPFLAPKGVQSVATGKPVTSSQKVPITGELKMITDGRKGGFDEDVVILRRQTQWIQVDLGAAHEIFAILLWHEHKSPMIYRDVIVQVSDDADFVEGVKTIFNNDQDNSSGLGIGTDREYFESHEGKLIDAKGAKGRYVRCYSKGSTDNALNCYTEVEVWGRPAQ